MRQVEGKFIGTWHLIYTRLCKSLSSNICPYIIVGNESRNRGVCPSKLKLRNEIILSDVGLDCTSDSAPECAL